MTAILQLSDLRRVVTDRCDALGLTDRAKTLRAKHVTDYPEETRRQLCELNLAARDVHAVASKAYGSAPEILGPIVEGALALETDAARAIVLCDRIIAERFEALEASKTSRPILATGRHMNLSRGREQ